MTRVRGPSKNSLLAIKQFEMAGLEPIAEVIEAMEYAKEMTKKGGNIDAEGRSDQVNWCGLWLKASLDLCKYRYPQLSAVSIDVHGGDSTKHIMSAQDALKAIQKDPFFPKNIDTKDVVEAMNINVNPKLPLGAKEKDV